jgi:hypothetical protein
MGPCIHTEANNMRQKAYDDIPSQIVSEPVASSPATLERPDAHTVHTCDDTYSSVAQRVAIIPMHYKYIYTYIHIYIYIYTYIYVYIYIYICTIILYVNCLSSLYIHTVIYTMVHWTYSERAVTGQWQSNAVQCKCSKSTQWKYTESTEWK